MKTINVAIINNVSLQVVADERDQLVAVKPVCEILGVDFSAQRTKLKEHPLFSSVMVLSTTTGADGKMYEMACIPLRYFSSWLFSINPNNVKEGIRDNVLEFQLKCNDILFDYFFNRADFAQKKEKAVAKAKELLDEKTETFKEARDELKEAEKNFSKALALTFEDYDAERRQLTLPGFE
jgi:hypothetical protein